MALHIVVEAVSSLYILCREPVNNGGTIDDDRDGGRSQVQGRDIPGAVSEPAEHAAARA